MKEKEFFERLRTMKDGDAAYITITKENGKLYYNGGEIEK
jgi:hypothetical protein